MDVSATGELAELFTVAVKLFGEDGAPLQVRVPASRSSQRVCAESIHAKVCEQLGISEKNSSYFILTEGVDRPTRTYTNDELALPSNELCFRKWVFNINTERTMLDDPSALHLLYLHSRRTVVTGEVHVNPAQQAQLEEYEQCHFVQERQYVETCLSLPLYDCVHFPGCTLRRQFIIAELPLKEQFTLGLSKQGLYVQTESLRYGAPWLRLKSWSMSTDKTWVAFAIMLDTGTTSLLYLSTTQTDYMLNVIDQLVRQVQLDHEEMPSFHTDMVHRCADHTEWDNVLYDPDSKYPALDVSMDMCTLTHFCPSP